MAGRVVLLAQTSQDQQNNSVKHPKTVEELYYSIHHCLLLVVTLSGAHYAIALKNNARATS